MDDMTFKTKVNYSYLAEQFNDTDSKQISDKILEVVKRGDFTLGYELRAFEHEFANACHINHAIGVNSGTDALFLSLKALGIGGEVVTTPYSFYATTASIVNAGAKPVYADVGYDFNIDPKAIEATITPRTEAIIPVHWAGRPCDMTAIREIADRHSLAVIEDCAHAFGSSWNDIPCGGWGKTGCFSLHPLKTLNVWGDGGIIVTNDEVLSDKLRRMRNHGLVNRDTCGEWGWNSRLDTVQAVVARHVLPQTQRAINARRVNALRLNMLLWDVPGLNFEPIPSQAFMTYYIYTFRHLHRDQLVSWLVQNHIDAKVHYPTPLHLQPAAKGLGYKRGDFPVCEELANQTISLPAHEYVMPDQINRMGDLIRDFK